MKTEILRLLKTSQDFISGQQLCEQFQVSRTAVWKVIDQLKKEGYEIEAVRNKGYRLIDSSDVLSKAEIESQITTKWAGKKRTPGQRNLAMQVIRKITGRYSWQTDRSLEREEEEEHGSLLPAAVFI